MFVIFIIIVVVVVVIAANKKNSGNGKVDRNIEEETYDFDMLENDSDSKMNSSYYGLNGLNDIFDIDIKNEDKKEQIEELSCALNQVAENLKDEEKGKTNTYVSTSMEEYRKNLDSSYDEKTDVTIPKTVPSNIDECQNEFDSLLVEENCIEEIQEELDEKTEIIDETVNEENIEEVVSSNIQLEEFMKQDFSKDHIYSFIEKLKKIDGLEKTKFLIPIIHEKPESLRMDVWVTYKQRVERGY